MNDDTSPQHCAGSEQTSLSELQDNHIGRLLLQAQRACAKRSIAKLRARGHDRLTLAHTALLPHLEMSGTSATVLAERAGMTKQSMGQLVVDLEEKGYVSRVPDPNDRRATLVTFTEEGWRFLRDAREVKKEMETEYLAILGQERLDDLRQSLMSLIEKSGREKPEQEASES
jgi:DNA-binding MarR family transcriptional regulator